MNFFFLENFFFTRLTKKKVFKEDRVDKLFERSSLLGVIFLTR